MQRAIQGQEDARNKTFRCLETTGFHRQSASKQHSEHSWQQPKTKEGEHAETALSPALRQGPNDRCKRWAESVNIKHPD